LGFLASYLRFTHTPPERNRTPVTLLHPGRDAWTPIELSARVLSRAAGPVELVILRECGHFPVEDPGVTELVDAVAGLRELGLDPDPGAFTRSTLACTGLEFCKFAIVETKKLAAARAEPAGASEGPSTVEVSGQCSQVPLVDAVRTMVEAISEVVTPPRSDASAATAAGDPTPSSSPPSHAGGPPRSSRT